MVEFAAGDQFDVGPFQVRTWPLPHWVPNAGVRLAAAGRVLAYTGDTGPSPAIAELARGADLFLAEASYPTQVPADAAAYLSSARQAGEDAAAAGRRPAAADAPAAGDGARPGRGRGRRRLRRHGRGRQGGVVADLG